MFSRGVSYKTDPCIISVKKEFYNQRSYRATQSGEVASARVTAVLTRSVFTCDRLSEHVVKETLTRGGACWSGVHILIFLFRHTRLASYVMVYTISLQRKEQLPLIS